MQKRGFTLIELLVVIVIIGILVAIALPNFIKIKDKAKEAEVKQNLHSIQLSLERYAVDSSASDYPLFVMGGDWTDSCVVWQSWLDNQGMTTGDINNPTRQAEWTAAPQYMGDSMVMESYMPNYPVNPFNKGKASTLVPHVLHNWGGLEWNRTIAGFECNKMVEIHGPVDGPANDDGSNQPFGDICVHHIYNNPPYNIHDNLKNPINGWTNSSGNRVLVGNFSYYPRQGEGGLGWAWLNAVQDCVGYTMAGFGALRTAGQDVFNRNGDFKGRYRTVAPSMALAGYVICSGQVGALLNPTDPPSVLRNNGGSDTVKDGVVVTLDSGVDITSKRTNAETTEGEGVDQ